MKKFILIICLSLMGFSIASQISFNSGMLSEILKFRIDFDKRSMALEDSENMLVQPEGPIFRRTGTEFIDEALTEFSYTVTDTNGSGGVDGNYPTLRTVADQADPNLKHTIAISSITELRDKIDKKFTILNFSNLGNGVISVQVSESMAGYIEAGDPIVIYGTTNYNNGYSDVNIIDNTHFTFSDDSPTEDDWKGDDATGYCYISGVMRGNFYLTQNIDASDTSSWNSGDGWYSLGVLQPAPISGNPANRPFVGTLDGNGYTISNLYQNQGSTSVITQKVGGLFFSIYGSVVNLTLSNVDLTIIRGGALAYGVASSGSGIEPIVQNCHASGNIKAYNLNALYTTGGLIGTAIGSSPNYVSIYDCSSSVNIDYNGGHTDTNPYYVGGFIGTVGTYTIISNCYATGNIDVAGTSSDSRFIGGFVGLIGGNYANITDSYATGTIKGDKWVGGFIGNKGSGTSCNITRCYCTGAIQAYVTPAGGFAGYSVGTGFVDCYTWSNVTSATNAMGFVGYSLSTVYTRCYCIGDLTGSDVYGFSKETSTRADYCYFNTETTGTETTGLGVGKTTIEMKTKSTYQTWDFDTVWDMTEYEEGGETTTTTVTILSSDKTRLIPFTYSNTDNYVLEFGHNFVGFLR